MDGKWQMNSTGCSFTMDMGEVERTYGVMCLGTKWFILFWAFELESVGRDMQGLRSQVTCLSPPLAHTTFHGAV